MFRKLRSRHGVPCLDVVCGNAYIVNESDTEIIGFTMRDFMFVRIQLFSYAMVNLLKALSPIY